ncbi:MAG TPA: hypothetical protein VHN98_09605 [Acidimicrobiales bacterium]|nr:hypothetical protein [Acidimicrobiales bacterium]
MHDALLFLAAFLASTVEMVEALTIVLAVGVTRSWRSTGWGVGLALLALAAIVALLGPALTRLPIDALRIGVGTLLLVFGLQWLRKAILRATGLKAMHDEAQIYEEEIDEAAHAARVERAGLDWYAFTVAFKGVFLEGLEVAFIVVTFGGTQRNVPLAAAAAAAALVLVLAVGAVVHAPLSRVPENTLKFGVGLMLTSFGIFWAGEGAGAHWPGGDAALLGVLAFVAVLSFALVTALRPAAEVVSEGSDA